MFDISSVEVEVKDLDEVYFTFSCLCTSFSNARRIYDYEYKFKEAISDVCKDIILEIDVEGCAAETIIKVIKYLVGIFTNTTMIRLSGKYVTLTKFFDCTVAIKEFDLDNKITVEFDKPKDISDEISSDASSSTEDELLFRNTSEIELENVEFAYYSKERNTHLIAEAKKFKINFYNDKWVQWGGYLYILEF